MSGSSGLVGSSLVPFLTAGGHRVTRLLRGGARAGEDARLWDPDRGTIDAAGLEGHDAVIHLAGENLATGRWTPAKKARIRESRVRGTTLLSEALAGLSRPPRVLVSASAVGYYGSRGSEILDEESPPGTGFLAEVCREWEAATEPARRKGIRVVNLRLGVVLSGAGGALKKMLLPFKLGAGGRIGDGNQYVSWIAMDDLLGAVHHVLLRDDIAGPVNVVSPFPVTNSELAASLAHILSRPAVLPLPAFAARLAFGEMADEALLSSTRAAPRKLLGSGFSFAYPDLEAALRHVLGRQT